MHKEVRLAVVALTALTAFAGVALGYGAVRLNRIRADVKSGGAVDVRRALPDDANPARATGLLNDGPVRAQDSDSANAQPPTPQTWSIISDWGATAIVVVSPFTHSGTFDEVDTSPGWQTWHYLCDTTGAVIDSVLMRIPVSGTIAHSGQGDAWSFTITVMNNGMSYTGSGDGTSDGNFPDATTASGTYSVSMNAEGYKPSQVSGTWTAYRD